MSSKGLSFFLLSLIAASTLTVTAYAQTAGTQGKWAAVKAWPHVAIHMSLLSDGRVLTWERGDSLAVPGQGYAPATVWNPDAGTFTNVAYTSADLFCAGHSLLPDGRLLVTGGHYLDHVGIANTTYFDPATNSWTAGPLMNAGRWYPTNTTLANGDVLITSGDMGGNNDTNPLPQVYQTDGTIRDLTGALFELPLYPRNFLALDGRVLSTIPNARSRWLDTSGTGSWKLGPRTVNDIYRSYGTAVMYAPGKIMIAGGGSPPTNTAEVIDLNVATPAWRDVSPMQYARRQHNATLLPDGKVLVTGGTSAAGFNDATGAVLPAEIWDPATEAWTTVAAMQVPRLYHSTAVLLPDGRVLSAGGGRPPSDTGGDVNHLDSEIYKPPYFFKADGTNAARPSIRSWPSNVTYGQTFYMSVTQTARIRKVSWIRLGSVTHAFNMEQRFMTLSFVRSGKGLNVTAPSDPNISPPGYYSIFVLNDTGTPSAGQIVRIQ
jgi:hypothetical protein